MSWPSSSHPIVGFRCSASEDDHPFTQSMISRLLSGADKWIGMNDSIGWPSMIPAAKKPRETPSVPCAIIRVPETWKMCNLIPALFERRRRRTTKSSNLGDNEDPFSAQASTVALSVNMKTSLSRRLPCSASSSSDSTILVNSFQLDDSKESEEPHTPTR